MKCFMIQYCTVCIIVMKIVFITMLCLPLKIYVLMLKHCFNFICTGLQTQKISMSFRQF